MKILIVDDEALALSLLQRMLTSLGYHDITQVSSAQEALDAVQADAYDLVLLDINMPQTNGLELGYELRLSRRYGDHFSNCLRSACT